MARLRATAPAARSVLDGREHDGRLHRVGAAISRSNKQTIKRRPRKTIKKRTDAYTEKIDASFKNGVLKVVMPKTAEALKSVKKVEVKGG